MRVPLHPSGAGADAWLYPRIARLFARQTAEMSLLVDRDALRARLNRPFDVKELTMGLTNETYLVACP
jgi:hypothetical protein